MNPIQYAYMAITTEIDVRRHTNKLQRELKRENRENRKAGINIELDRENDENINTTTEEAAIAASSSEVTVAEPSTKGSETEIVGNPNYTHEPETEPKEESVAETATEPNAEPAQETVAEPVPELVEVIEEVTTESATEQESTADSASIPRVEDTHKSGDRKVDFSYFHQTKTESTDKQVNLNKAARTVRQAEKDVPPEERSIEGRICDYIAAGAIPYQQQMVQQPMYPYVYYPYMQPAQQPQYVYVPYQHIMPQQTTAPVVQPNQPAQSTQLPPGFGRHRVDNQPPPEKPKQEKAKAEECEGVDQVANITQEATEALGVEEKSQNVKFSIFSKYHNPPGNTEEEINQAIQSQNQELKSKYWWLEGIEKAANSNGVSVQFIDSNDGIVLVIAYTKNQENNYIFNQFKSFIIDYGRHFYDRRIKIFLTIDPESVIPSMANGFEFINNSNSNNGEKSLNMDLLNMIFKAGTIIDPASGMYSEKLRQLNLYVDVGSAPTKKMDNKTNDRNDARNRLFASVDAGVFAVAKTYDPLCRFKYYDFDTKSKVFMLVNAETPTEIAILYTPKGADILTDGMQDAISKYEEAKQKYKSVEKKKQNKNG